MIPKVFVSSTIEDLGFLREVVRSVVLELGYQPVLSEFGGVGYSPIRSALDSCLREIAECQIAILLIGKRYGSTLIDGLSPTHRELQSARDSSVPIFCLVDSQVLHFKRIRDANRGNQVNYPGLEDAEKIFGLIDEYYNAPRNNGYTQYSTIEDARCNIKTQIAHFVGELLRDRFHTTTSDIHELLAEVKALRHETRPSESSATASYKRAIRVLLDYRNSGVYLIADQVFDSTDRIASSLADCATWKQFVESGGAKLVVKDSLAEERRLLEQVHNRTPISGPHVKQFTSRGNISDPELVAVLSDKTVVTNVSADVALNREYKNLHELVVA